ncbi:uncharacterized protein LOC122026914 [Zingiber officinale]|uniref:Uncharacterized protein n=1 Tax=Zingiber officinale TaxID=94328 RepID=A0A8J5CD37_ZINOF|nr:uncharacterized protein LOC122026914 [Zingiber officinale]XP_042441586.1 uncharacterized protein LOC122026914 [Zingiber officinale]KAG6473366.1 hypothetical protein ZIOFF_067281 [Zingiber officinale]
MEGFIDQYEKEPMSMKTVMLKQEETFRQQVQELHRLYRTQKMLMRDAKLDRESWKPLHSNSSQRTLEDNEDLKLDADEESDLELTLATGSYGTHRKKRSASNTSESGSSFSSSPRESGSVKHPNPDWAVPDDSTRIGGGRKGTVFKIEQMRHDGLQQPSWLFSCNKQHDMVASFGL